MHKLSIKVTSIIILAVVIAVGINGFYFDSFIQDSFFENVKEKSISANQRVIDDISKIENNLKKETEFLDEDMILIASMNLINNYQDKNNYNVYLIDEEKKIIVNRMYEKVKNSLNNSIVIFDKNEELTAYVKKMSDDRYKLSFISYENGKPFIYSRYENDENFVREEYRNTKYYNFRHQLFYSTKMFLSSSTIITHHYDNKSLTIRAHKSLNSRGEDKRPIAHIEISKILYSKYFSTVSNDLGVDIFISNDNIYAKNSLLFNQHKNLTTEDINQNSDAYFSSISISTEDKPMFVVIKLHKSQLHKALNKSRLQTLSVLLITLIVIVIILEIVLKNNLSMPLDYLMEQLEKVQNEDYSLTKVVKTKDELQKISESINNLSSTVSKREIALKDTQLKLEYLSTHDELTNLLNRREFNYKFHDALEKAYINSNRVALLFLDLDQFKQVNDVLGHVVGDNLLKDVSKRLSTLVNEKVTLARVGGDEFNIVIENVNNIDEVEKFAKSVLNLFREPFVEDYSEITISTSIGVAIFPEDGRDTVTLTKNADLAMYYSKEIGRNNFSFYNKKFSDSIERKSEIVIALKQAIKNGDEFQLFYQPKVSIKGDKILAVEALIRWNSSSLGFVGPNEFISIAEETHLIIEIGEWIIDQAVNDFVELQKGGYYFDQVSVNISGIQLQYSDIRIYIENVLKKTEIQPHQLEVEITESYIASDESEAIEKLKTLRNLGIELAIDDFGTGYSSMSYLQKLPVTRLKVDKSFVDNLPHSEESIAVIKAILALAEAFSLKVTVEGVEFIEQLKFFDRKYCDDIQGYLFSKPLPLEELKKFIANFNLGKRDSLS